jgi:hypothetical protein
MNFTFLLRIQKSMDFTIFELEFWSPSTTNLKYEQAQITFLQINKQRKNCFCQLLPFAFLKHYFF